MVELERAELQVEDLKQQLDDALGAEDMLEQLTERNLTLTEVRLRFVELEKERADLSYSIASGRALGSSGGLGSAA